MARPVVHIGYHKTATTWFQEEVYPKAISHRWIPRALARDSLLKPYGCSFDAGKTRARLSDDADPRPPVICEENLSGYIHNGGLHGLMAPEAARRIKATFPDALVVIVIRGQPEMIASTYVQYVRGGGTFGVRRYLFGGRWSLGALQHPYKAPRFDFGHFEYDRLVAYYDTLFGSENVLVLPYEELCRSPEAFLATLACQAELEFEGEPPSRKRSNVSFGRFTIAVARLLGLFTSRSVVNKTVLLSIPGFYEIRRLVLKGLGRFDRAASAKAILGQEHLAGIQRHYVESNSRLLALRGLKLRELGYPVDLVSRQTPAEQKTGPSPIRSSALFKWSQDFRGDGGELR